MWQDIGLSVVVILFNIALVPQIIYGARVKRKTIATLTALLTVLGTAFIAYIYFSLKLYASAGIQIVTTILWGILLLQSIKYRKKN
jgi:hypothetical protein